MDYIASFIRHFSLGIIIMLVSLFKTTAQHEYYTVEWGMSNYDTLTDHASILEEDFYNSNNSLFFVDVELEFGFTFPYFETTQTTVWVDGGGYAFFENFSDEDYNLFLYGGEYESLEDTVSSRRTDLRYAYMKEEGVDVLKIEWKNAAILDDVYSDMPTDHAINYQVWFYENGDIEVHFGGMDLENTPFFDPEIGMMWEDGEVHGPWLGIGDDVLDEVYYFSGSFDEPTIIKSEDDSDIVLGTPPEGFFVRFKYNRLVSTEEPKTAANALLVSPTPATSEIRWKVQQNYMGNSTLYIYNLQGMSIKTIETEDNKGIINVSDIPSGMYILTLVTSSGGRYHTKFKKL